MDFLKKLTWGRVVLALVGVFIALYPLIGGKSYILHLFILFFLGSCGGELEPPYRVRRDYLFGKCWFSGHRRLHLRHIGQIPGALSLDRDPARGFRLDGAGDCVSGATHA